MVVSCFKSIIKHRNQYASNEVMTRTVICRLQRPTIILFITGFWATGLIAATNEASNDSETIWLWNLFIALIVLLVTAASAALPLAAIKQWNRHWRIGAAIPLLVLLIWLAVIAVSRSLSDETHQLWPFEIFAWAMLNMIYMVALMTAKRLFDKEDEKSNANN